MPSYCEICKESCNIHPLPLSEIIMTTCESACRGDYGMDDCRCVLFIFVPFTFVIDLLCIVPRCTKKCVCGVKEKIKNEKDNESNCKNKSIPEKVITTECQKQVI